jgi:uncharacterized membrane protein
MGTIVLGIILASLIANKYPDLSKEAKAASAKTAGQFSRINTLLSIPMLFCMVAASHL